MIFFAMIDAVIRRARCRARSSAKMRVRCARAAYVRANGDARHEHAAMPTEKGRLCQPSAADAVAETPPQFSYAARSSASDAAPCAIAAARRQR